MTTRHLLLTNDDGVDSPALLPFAAALDRLGEVAVVVPDRERSWIGKAITRQDEILLTAVEREGRAVHTTTGYPADATQLGITVVTDPDVVVSGINLGHNHGVGFMMSSGTVGAAVEGWISGRTAVAFSTGLWGGDYAAWRDWCETPDARPAWERLAETCAQVLEDVLASGITDHADVVSVNLPFDATSATPRRVTSLARVGYAGLFRPDGGGYRHRFSELVEFGPLDGTDVEAARHGAVSITPLLMPAAAAIPDDLVRSLTDGPTLQPTRPETAT